MLFHAGRLRNDVSAEQYMKHIVLAMGLIVLPIAPEIAIMSQQGVFIHKDPADRLIVSTAIVYKIQLIPADTELRDVKSLDIIW